MKTIEVDEELYRYIASQTCHIGESASEILRRLLNVDGQAPVAADVDTSHIQAIQRESNQQPITESNAIINGQDAAQKPAIDGVKAIRTLLISDEFAEQKKVIDRFMLVLSTLWNIDSVSFADAIQVKGRKRVYFADNEQTLLDGGTTTKPKAIPHTPFWVITNTNTSRKQQMVEQVMVRMNFPVELIEKVTNAI
jgi:negative modulator of initiation of replication